MKAFRINQTEIVAAPNLLEAVKEISSIEHPEDVTSAVELTKYELDTTIIYEQLEENGPVVERGTIREVLEGWGEPSTDILATAND